MYHLYAKILNLHTSPGLETQFVIITRLPVGRSGVLNSTCFCYFFRFQKSAQRSWVIPLNIAVLSPTFKLVNHLKYILFQFWSMSWQYSQLAFLPIMQIFLGGAKHLLGEQEYFCGVCSPLQPPCMPQKIHSFFQLFLFWTFIFHIIINSIFHSRYIVLCLTRLQ